MDDQGTPTRSNGTAAADGGWQKELVDAVVSQVDEKLTNGSEHDPAPTNDAGAVKQIAAIPPTPEGRIAYLAEIDGPRPIADGATLDNAVASFRANDVYLAAGTTRDVEVPVWMANSTVTVVKVGVDDEHSEGFDVGYGVSISAPDGGANEKVIEADRRITTIGSEAEPALTFKVEQVPATVLLKFDNAYSWINSKKVQYHVEVEPPIDEEIIARSARAEAAIDTLALELNKAKEGVAQIETVRQSVEQKATQAKKTAEDCRKDLEAKIDDFQKSVKAVKQIEQTLKEKEVETEKNEKTAAQMIDEKDQIQARIEELRKALQAAESELESKLEQIQAQKDLVSANKKDVVAMEEDIDNRLNGIEESGAKVKEMEALMKETDEASIEASREQAIIAEEEGKAKDHLKFYEKLFSDLKLRLMETPQEV